MRRSHDNMFESNKPRERMRKTSVTTVNMEFDEYIAHQHVSTWFVRRIRISKNGNISFTNCSECSLTFAAFVPIACTHSSNDTYSMFILILIPAICSGTALIAYFWLCVESHANMKFHTQAVERRQNYDNVCDCKMKEFCIYIASLCTHNYKSTFVEYIYTSKYILTPALNRIE